MPRGFFLIKIEEAAALSERLNPNSASVIAYYSISI